MDVSLSKPFIFGEMSWLSMDFPLVNHSEDCPIPETSTNFDGWTLPVHRGRRFVGAVTGGLCVAGLQRSLPTAPQHLDPQAVAGRRNGMSCSHPVVRSVVTPRNPVWKTRGFNDGKWWKMMGLSWDYHGIIMGLSWDYYGIIMGLYMDEDIVDNGW